MARNMTRKEQNLHTYLQRLLKTQGYKTYGQLLGKFDLFLTTNPEVAAYMEPDKGRIVVNSTLDEQQISTIIRHEILHQYLKHEARLIDHLQHRHKELENIDNIPINQLKNELYSNQIFNIAADYEISNRGYTQKDKENVRAILLNNEIVKGLVTEDEHPDWVDLSVEEMYDKLLDIKAEDERKAREQEAANDVLIIGIPGGDTVFRSFNGTIYDGALYDPEVDKKRRKSRR